MYRLSLSFLSMRVSIPLFTANKFNLNVQWCHFSFVWIGFLSPIHLVRIFPLLLLLHSLMKWNRTLYFTMLLYSLVIVSFFSVSVSSKTVFYWICSRMANNVFFKGKTFWLSNLFFLFLFLIAEHLSIFNFLYVCMCVKAVIS